MQSTKPKPYQTTRSTKQQIHWHPLTSTDTLIDSFSSCFMLTLSHIVLAKTGKVHQSLTRSSTAFKTQLKLERRKSVIFDVYKVKGQSALQRVHSVPPTKPSFCPWKGAGSRSPLNFGTCSPIASTFTKVSYSILCGQSIPTKVVSFSKVSNSKNRKMAAVTNVCCTQLR